MGYYTITEEDQHVTATRRLSILCEQKTSYSGPNSPVGDGPGTDNILSMTCYTGTIAKTYFYLTDHLGSVHALADESGNIVESYNYDAWGRVLGVYDSNGNTLEKSAVGNRYLWQGREYSFATGLYYFRARYYDPVTGRWLSNDPAGISGGLNQYVFCRNNPVNFRDPSGRFAIGAVVGGITGGISGGIGAYLSGGHWDDILVGAAVGGALGVAVGLVDPSEGLLTLAAIGSISGQAGDLAGQAYTKKIAPLFKDKCEENKAINWSESGIAGLVGGVSAVSGGMLTIATMDVIGEAAATWLGGAASAVPGTFVGAASEPNNRMGRPY